MINTKDTQLENILEKIIASSKDKRTRLNKGSLEDIKKRCRKDHKFGCYHLAEFVSAVDINSSNDLFLFSCTKGYLQACESFIAQAHPEKTAKDIAESTQLLNIAKSSCNVDEPVLHTKGCQRYAQVLLAQGEIDAGRELLQELSSVSGEGYGKLDLAKLAQEDGHKEFACALRHEACRQQIVPACALSRKCENTLAKKMKKLGKADYGSPSSMVYQLAELSFKDGKLEEAQEQFALLCKYGYLNFMPVNGKPYACSRGQQLAEIQTKQKEEQPKLEEACFKEKNIESCDDLHHIYSLAGEYSKAASLSKEECQTSNIDSSLGSELPCLRHLGDLKKAEQFDQAVTLAEKSCKSGSDVFCLEAARLYTQLDDKQRAFEFAANACLKYFRGACPLRDRLIAERGVATAKDYFTDLCKNNEPLACLNLSFFNEIEDSKQDAYTLREKSKDLFDKLCKEYSSNEPNKRRTEEICLTSAAIRCFVGEKKKGQEMFKEYCKNNSRMACRFLKNEGCENGLNKALADFKRTFRLN